MLIMGIHICLECVPLAVHRHYRTTACLVNVEADFVYYLRSKFYVSFEMLLLSSPFTFFSVKDERFVRTAASVSDTFYPSTSGVYRGKVSSKYNSGFSEYLILM